MLTLNWKPNEEHCLQILFSQKLIEKKLKKVLAIIEILLSYKIFDVFKLETISVIVI